MTSFICSVTSTAIGGEDLDTASGSDWTSGSVEEIESTISISEGGCCGANERGNIGRGDRLELHDRR
ncbi:hypothetical protein [Phaffia rhodozyma]|uniref:Uncharacterized protein n=1 Tax=Phaffia rhodozyma TaxID=264483 RepID=A0A0F7SIY8_PHARH|nr:hypothetical protein [Phaffia rhodozyma]